VPDTVNRTVACHSGTPDPVGHNDPVTARRVVILGSTGSIGTQAIDVIRRNPDLFEVTAVCSAGSDPAALAQQACALQVQFVGVSDESALAEVTERIAAGWPGGSPRPDVIGGPSTTAELAALDADVVLNAVAGAQGLRATLAALAAGRTIALANKESLIAGGSLVTRAAAPGQLVALDSEHSALAQCLRGGTHAEVRRLLLTASGGPFRGRSRAELLDVTPTQALAHPTWTMGPLVTTNSATLVNKGLEVIEAHLLFDVPYERIDVVVHPQSVVHSMVEFVDGSTLAQASPPDMRLPISLALGWPDRIADAASAVDWTNAQQWTFEPLDPAAFPAVGLARLAGEAGGCAPAVFNAANEELVAAFHRFDIGFLVEAAQSWARECARRALGG
jgi:1-deoxy-D-xylulose-5-phosphate reductoisomerase